MPANDFLEFAGTDTGTNLLTQAAYAADAQRQIGHQPGNARAQLANKVARQSSLVAAAVAVLIANGQTADVVDTLTPAALATMFSNALRSTVIPTATAGGTADVITAAFFPALVAPIPDGQLVVVQHTAANATTSPSLSPNGIAAGTIVKGNNLPLAITDIPGADFWGIYTWDLSLGRWVMSNPATGILQRTGQPGIIQYVPATSPPAGYIKANGALLNRVSFAALWAFAQASGNIAVSDAAWQSGQFSPGDGATTFRIPDARGYHLRAFDDTRGIDSGRGLGTTQADQFPSHGHVVNDPTHGHAATVSDPGHGHLIQHDPQSNTSGAGLSGSGVAGGATWQSDVNNTGITVGIGAAATGISLQSTGTGTETRVKNIALLAIISF